MNLESEVKHDVLIFHVNQNVLDASSAPAFKQQVMEGIEENKVYALIFDLSSLQFIDSSGLGVFLATLRHLNEHGGDLKIAGMTNTVRAMFQIVRMHKLFETFNTVDEALRAFSPA